MKCAYKWVQHGNNFISSLEPIDSWTNINHHSCHISHCRNLKDEQNWLYNFTKYYVKGYTWQELPCYCKQKNKATTGYMSKEQAKYPTDTLHPWAGKIWLLLIRYNIRFFPPRNTKWYSSLRGVEESVTLHSPFYDTNLEFRFFISLLRWNGHPAIQS
jgi:hypothetical protein